MRRALLTITLAMAILLATGPSSAPSEEACRIPFGLAGQLYCLDDRPELGSPVEVDGLIGQLEVALVATGTGQNDRLSYSHYVALSEAKREKYRASAFKRPWGPCFSIVIADVDIFQLTINGQLHQWGVVEMGRYTVGVYRNAAGVPMTAMDLTEFRPQLKRIKRILWNGCLLRKSREI